MGTTGTSLLVGAQRSGYHVRPGEACLNLSPLNSQLLIHSRGLQFPSLGDEEAHLVEPPVRPPPRTWPIARRGLLTSPHRSRGRGGQREVQLRGRTRLGDATGLRTRRNDEAKFTFHVAILLKRGGHPWSVAPRPGFFPRPGRSQGRAGFHGGSDATRKHRVQKRPLRLHLDPQRIAYL